MSMKLLYVTAAAAALASSACGVVMPQSQGAAFSMDAITPSAPQHFDPAAELQRLWAKFPTTGHMNTKQARANKQEGSVPANPSSSGLSFFVPTIIGNQTFNLIFDTGSADL
jgi:aspergillopepsin I